MNETTEILFDSIVEDTAYAELGQSICTTETVMGNEVECPVCSNVQPSAPRRTRNCRNKKKKRPKETFLWKTRGGEKQSAQMPFRLKISC